MLSKTMRAISSVLLLCASATWSVAQSSAPTREQQASKTLSHRALGEIARDPSGWVTLQSLASTAASPDRSLAAEASLVALEITYSLDLQAIENYEIPRASLGTNRELWFRIARDEKRWVDLRVVALEVTAQLERVAQLSGQAFAPAPWLELLSDTDPEMRLAGIGLAPSAPQIESTLRALVTNSISEEIALAAASRVCGPIRFDIGSAPSLAGAELARLQTLARTSTLPIVARANLVPCLVKDKSPESRRAVSLLASESPPALRRDLLQIIRAASDAARVLP